jgi:hypothetical protein
VIIDDRALDPRAIEMLATLLVRQNGDRAAAARSAARRRLLPRPSNERTGAQGAMRARDAGKP